MTDSESTTRHELEAIARRWIVEGWQRGNADAVRKMYAPDFVDLSNPYAEHGSRDDNVRGITALYAAFPDFHAEIEDLIVDAEQAKVAVRWSATGTHRGIFFDVPVTGQRIIFHGIETLCIAGGLIAERSGEWDGFETLRQLNAD